MKILVVDACVRGEVSRTRKLYEKLIEDQVHKAEIEILKLADQDLKPLTAEQVDLRVKLVNSGKFEHEMFRYAHQFKEADLIIVAAPNWDLSFPSILKVYLEHVAVTGITFGYEGADCVGYCRAKKIIYLSTCGGFVNGPHLGAEYVKMYADMLGIHDFSEFSVQGLDIDPSQEAMLMAQGREEMLSKNLLS